MLSHLRAHTRTRGHVGWLQAPGQAELDTVKQQLILTMRTPSSPAHNKLAVVLDKLVTRIRLAALGAQQRRAARERAERAGAKQPGSAQRQVSSVHRRLIFASRREHASEEEEDVRLRLAHPYQHLPPSLPSLRKQCVMTRLEFSGATAGRDRTGRVMSNRQSGLSGGPSAFAQHRGLHASPSPCCRCVHLPSLWLRCASSPRGGGGAVVYCSGGVLHVSAARTM